MLLISARAGIAALSDGIVAKANGSTSNFSQTSVEGNGSSGSSSRSTSGANIARTNGSTATANSYATASVYIPNYRSSAFKQFIIRTSSETNAATTYQNLYAVLWSNTAAITSLSFPQNSGSNYTNASTFSLYGIIRSGA
jgi:hypothetical protein